MTRLLQKVASASFVLYVAAFSSPPVPHAQDLPRFPPQEDLNYEVQVFWITRAAQGHLRIERRGEDHYRAELIAETKGVVRWLTGSRKNHYISEMAYDPQKRRFISRQYTKLIFKGKNAERTTAAIDEEKSVVDWEFFSNGKLIAEGADPIPDKVRYEDLLSAFFNFRTGQLVPLEPGREMTVFTLPDYRAIAKEKMGRDDKERFQKFEIRIADEETETAYRKKFGRTKEKGMLVLVKVPKNLFGQETGEIRVWFNTNLVPVAATVEDAYYFGDVHGILIKPDTRP
ncbi:DUF3108 domain-containing protein [Nitrospinota bacterium]